MSNPGDSHPSVLSGPSSVTVWLGVLRAGDADAAQQLWQRYVDRLVRLANRKLGELPRRVADEEDVALSAFRAFPEGVEDQRFSQLNDHDDLWQVLVMLVQRKAIALRKHVRAAKRGPGQVRGESALPVGDPMSTAAPGIGNLAGCEPTPQFAAQAQEELGRLLALLDDDELRQIALAKLQGHTNQQMAEQLDTSLRAIERKLRLIRQRWEAEIQL